MASLNQSLMGEMEADAVPPPATILHAPPTPQPDFGSPRQKPFNPSKFRTSTNIEDKRGEKLPMPDKVTIDGIVIRKPDYQR